MIEDWLLEDRYVPVGCLKTAADDAGDDSVMVYDLQSLQSSSLTIFIYCWFLTVFYLVDGTHFGFHEKRLPQYSSYIISLSLPLTTALHYMFPHLFALSHTLGTLSHK